jgi:hypothetical protein
MHLLGFCVPHWPAVARPQQRFWGMCHHVYGLNVCYDDDPLIIIRPCTYFSSPPCQMQLRLPVTSYPVAGFVGGLRSHFQNSSGKHTLHLKIPVCDLRSQLYKPQRGRCCLDPDS